MLEKIRLGFYGGAGTVTGANFLLEGKRIKVLIDCGLAQGEWFSDERNREPFPYDSVSVGYLLVTHAHIDHIGRIPKLVRDGFHGVILSTPETKTLAEIMLPDALSVMRSECASDEGLLYEKEDIGAAFSLWKTIPYRHPLLLGDELEVMFKDAGHILGSAMVEVWKSPLTKGALRPQVGGGLLQPPAHQNASAHFFNGDTELSQKRKILFTGDLGNSPSPLLKDTEAITDASYLVMESVYGDRNHENREERRELLAEIISAAYRRGGTLLIPCFSLEKTQVLLYEIDDLFEQKKIPSLPVFLDSPLAIKVTEVYKTMTDNLNDYAKKQIAKGDDIFSFPRLKLIMRASDASAIRGAPNPKIIIAGSGMSTGGRIIGHEKRYLSDSQNTILFVGYQAAGSLGRMIQEGMKKVRIGGEEIVIRASIKTISGYSSHKDSAHLLEFVARAADLPARGAQAGGGALEKVFVTMGEPKASLFLAQRIRDYVGVEAVVPERGESVIVSL